jgi:hypothetical protein
MRALLRGALPPSEHRRQLLHLLALSRPGKISINQGKESAWTP